MATPSLSPLTPDFLGIPIEVRTKIYALILRADCRLENHGIYIYCSKNHRCPKSFRGCTKILSVSRQIYDEAIELLHNLNQGPALTVDGKFKYALRQPLEFGKPAFFQSFKSTSKCYLPKPFDELQIIRMRKFVINIVLPEASLFRRSRVHPDRIASNIRELATALGKSKTMKVLSLQITRNDDSIHDRDDSDHESAVEPEFLSPLIESAFRTGFELIVQDGRKLQPGSAPDPLVEWVVNKAKTAGVKATKVEPVYLEEESRDYEPFSNEDPLAWTYTGPSTNSNEFEPEPLRPDMLEEDFPNPMAPAARYELVPQCRFKHCNEYFREKSELMEHLQHFPHHKQPFVRKTFNVLYPGATSTSCPRTCWTCAKPFDTVVTLEKHLDEAGHRRYGIVPKYREDNKWWSEKWRKHEKKLGWL